MYAKIEPVQTFQGTATVLFIDTVSVQPGAFATYRWYLLSDANATLTTNGITLAGDAYTAWGNDDEYLYTYTAGFLNLTITEIVQGDPSTPVDVTPAPVAVSAEPTVAGGN